MARANAAKNATEKTDAQASAVNLAAFPSGCPSQISAKRHDCQRKTNNQNNAEDNEYILARYNFGSHKLTSCTALIIRAPNLGG